jgi:hypothetical protein
MAECIQPLSCQVNIAAQCWEYLGLHLGMAMAKARHPGPTMGLRRPVTAWPQIEVKAASSSRARPAVPPGWLALQPWQRCIAEDLALLDTGPEQRALFVDAHPLATASCRVISTRMTSSAAQNT